MVERRLHERLELVARVTCEKVRRHRAAVDPDAHRGVGVARHSHQPGDLVGNRFLALDVVQVTGVVANLVDVRRDRSGQPIVLLQVDDQRRAGLATDLLDRRDLELVVDGDADDSRTGGAELLALADGGIDIAGLGRAHALYDERCVAADADGADGDRTGGALVKRMWHVWQP